ncbi:MAG: AI-2E family transporter [Myxococcaceae bacterium]
MLTSLAPSRWVLTLVVIVATALLASVIYPFAGAFFVAGVLAGALFPLHLRLSKRLRGRGGLSAGLLTFAVVLALLGPVGTLGAFVVREGLAASQYVQEALRSEEAFGLLSRLPLPLQDIARRTLEAVRPSQLGTLVGEQGVSAVATVGNLLSATGRALVQIVFMLIAMFFLLTDGPRLVTWLDDVIPLGRGQFRALMEEFRKVSVAVLYSTMATAAVQAAAAAIGYFIAQVPNALFFALLTFFVAFIPAVGAASVSVVLAALLFFGGNSLPAVFLLAWGVIVVGLIDNLVKPLLIRGNVEMHGGIVFFSLLGGLATFGGVGLIAGPLIVAFFVAAVRMARRERERIVEVGSDR